VMADQMAPLGGRQSPDHGATHADTLRSTKPQDRRPFGGKPARQRQRRISSLPLVVITPRLVGPVGEYATATYLKIDLVGLTSSRSKREA
jgi:hypothetical protein